MGYIRRSFGWGVCNRSLYDKPRQIGKGDGYVIAAVGIVLGLRRCLAVVSIALLMMCMVAMIILALKKGNRHTKLPFLPAVFVGYMVCMMCILL